MENHFWNYQNREQYVGKCLGRRTHGRRKMRQTEDESLVENENIPEETREELRKWLSDAKNTHKKVAKSPSKPEK